MSRADSDNPKFALLFALGSATCFAVMAVLVKVLSRTVSHHELVFWRSSLMWLIVTCFVVAHREQIPFSGRGIPVLVYRGFAGAVSLLCLFYTLGVLPMAYSMMLSWCSPIFVVFFSAIFLREMLPLRALGYVASAFLGLGLLLGIFGSGGGSDTNLDLLAVAVGLGGAALAATAYVAVRAMASQVGVLVILFYFSMVATLITAPLALPEMHWNHPLRTWIEIAGMGVIASTAQYFMTSAYRFGSAGLVSTLNLLSAGLSAVIGWAFFDESLAAMQWGGLGILITSILMISRVRA